MAVPSTVEIQEIEKQAQEELDQVRSEVEGEMWGPEEASDRS